MTRRPTRRPADRRDRRRPPSSAPRSTRPRSAAGMSGRGLNRTMCAITGCHPAWPAATATPAATGFPSGPARPAFGPRCQPRLPPPRSPPPGGRFGFHPRPSHAGRRPPRFPVGLRLLSTAIAEPPCPSAARGRDRRTRRRGSGSIAIRSRPPARSPYPPWPCGRGFHAAFGRSRSRSPYPPGGPWVDRDPVPAAGRDRRIRPWPCGRGFHADFGRSRSRSPYPPAGSWVDRDPVPAAGRDRRIRPGPAAAVSTRTSAARGRDRRTRRGLLGRSRSGPGRRSRSPYPPWPCGRGFHADFGRCGRDRRTRRGSLASVAIGSRPPVAIAVSTLARGRDGFHGRSPSRRGGRSRCSSRLRRAVTAFAVARPVAIAIGIARRSVRPMPPGRVATAGRAVVRAAAPAYRSRAACPPARRDGRRRAARGSGGGFSSRGILKRSRGSRCAPPGRQPRPRDSRLPPRAVCASRSSSGEFHSRPRGEPLHHRVRVTLLQLLQRRQQLLSSAARNAVGLPSRMIVQYLCRGGISARRSRLQPLQLFDRASFASGSSSGAAWRLLPCVRSRICLISVSSTLRM